ncbi:helical backbone metal receptor [Nocardiopsis sp. MG754419]|uniref:helical backbone metal receptor n=1 Tax=Nocardiopsis sp. MG754419 TaxID=2259865 RepID=UPI001BAAB621|nr:helical backbone metal receptor [Nocardiopsis sp. MG754419]MBR8741289.1 cobalamin-binding protein [Nocardiopsis sp. MG754419]
MVRPAGTSPPKDDLGHPLPSDGLPRRVVSLVPSLTEAIAHTAPEVLVGATVWCTHPADLTVERLRGTKNPHVRRIIELAPDLVVANREENRERHVLRLREAGIPVWVTDIRTVSGALASLRRLVDLVAPGTSPAWLGEAESVWAAPPPAERLRVAVPIWRDPWMFVGADTFAHDLLSRSGADNVCADRPGRYPAIGPEETTGADLVVLPDEPYAFGPEDGPEAFDAPTVCVSGRDLTWYGPSLVEARARLSTALDAHRPRRSGDR